MRINPILASTLIATVALLAFATWRLSMQSAQLDLLALQLSSTRSELEQTRTALDASAGRIEELEARIAAVERIQVQAFDTPVPISINVLNALPPGLYELETTTAFDAASEETSYSITHIVLELRDETRVHLGVARAGMVPKGAYFDYDSDGLIDAEMAIDFVREIPFVGRSLARSYDTRVAQNLYSIFIAEVEGATYTSIDDLRNGAAAQSSYLWDFVMRQYEAIEAWVLEQLAESSESEGIDVRNVLPQGEIAI